jgi:hypothetical protein
MEFKSLSASALETAIACPARFKVTNVDHAADESNDAADVGRVVHAALEVYVRASVVEKSEDQSLDFLTHCYRQQYPLIFGSLDVAAPTFVDGLSMLKPWHARTSFDGCEVLLLETKEDFPVPIPADPGVFIPFRYIFDRLDQLDETTYRVVDYKTIRANLNHEQLRRKLQARVYGLAAQIRHKDATRIYVEFDLLRHDRIGVVYSREENVDTWRLIKTKAQELWLMDDVPEQINSDCRYCVRAASCETLRSNINAGGIYSIDKIEEVVDLRRLLADQINGITSVVADLDEQLLKHMQQTEQLKIQGIESEAEVAIRYARSVTNPSEVARIVGPEIASRYGNFRLGDIDAMLKSEELTLEQKRQIQTYIRRAPGEPKIRTSKL